MISKYHFVVLFFHIGLL